MSRSCPCKWWHSAPSLSIVLAGSLQQHLLTRCELWCGRREQGDHRQPLVVFEEEERGALLPYDAEPYEVPDWRTAKVQLDHHIASRSALYSVPSTTCPPGTMVDVQLTAKVVRIYHQNTLIKVHRRTHRGGRATDYSDYPQELTPYTA